LIYKLENKEHLLYLVIIPVLIAFYWLIRRINIKKLDKLGDKNVVKSIYPSIAEGYQLLKYLLIVAAIFFLILGIANPQTGRQSITSRSVGFEIDFVIDVSNSMLAEDITPNRMEASRKVLFNLAKELKDHRIGITVFAGEAFNQIPPTADPNILDAVIASLSPDMVPTQGSDFNKAFQLAFQNFNKEDKQNKFIILLTDGENHGEEFSTTIREAVNSGITIHVVGVGTQKGARIPSVLVNGKKGFLKDSQGNVVVTKTDDALLAQIAQEGRGYYTKIDNSQGIRSIIESINNLPRKVERENVYSNYSDYYVYFIIVGLVLILLEFLLPEVKIKSKLTNQ
jgi:Ca-activated chloride channel homolog